MKPEEPAAIRPVGNVWTAGAVGLATFVASHIVLYQLIYATNSGYVLAYRSRSMLLRSLTWVENVAFAPTIWLTRSLTSTAKDLDLLGEMTLLEIVLLSAFYTSVSYLLVRGRLGAKLKSVTRGRPWIAYALWFGLVVVAFAKSS